MFIIDLTANLLRNLPVIFFKLVVFDESVDPLFWRTLCIQACCSSSLTMSLCIAVQRI